MFDPTQTTLSGVSRETLLTWLSDAQTALNRLNVGGQPVSVSYGEKSVTYSQSDRGFLEAWIYLIQRQLGLVRGRRALRPYFR